MVLTASVACEEEKANREADTITPKNTAEQVFSYGPLNIWKREPLDVFRPHYAWNIWKHNNHCF